MVIFHSYVKFPEGIHPFSYGFPIKTSIFLWFPYGFPIKTIKYPFSLNELWHVMNGMSHESGTYGPQIIAQLPYLANPHHPHQFAKVNIRSLH